MSGQRSTTPQINPEALLSQERAQQSNNVAPVPPPQQEKDEDVKDKVQPDVPNLPRPAVEDPIKTRPHPANLPAGVVPAPEVYAYHHNAQVGDESICQTLVDTVVSGLCSLNFLTDEQLSAHQEEIS